MWVLFKRGSAEPSIKVIPGESEYQGYRRRIKLMRTEAELKEFESRLKFKPRLKHR